MAMAISHSAAASLTSGFFYSVFRFLSLTRSNRADHPRWYVGDRDYSRLRCGVAETQPRPSARSLSSDACAEPMIRTLGASGVPRAWLGVPRKMTCGPTAGDMVFMTVQGHQLAHSGGAAWSLPRSS